MLQSTKRYISQRFATGFSNHHKLILSVFCSYFIRIPPKTIEYRNSKNFNETVFLHDLDQELLKGEMTRVITKCIQLLLRYLD